MDLTVRTLFAAAIGLLLLYVALVLFDAFGSAPAGLIRVTLILTGAFAVAGTVGGLVRALRRGGAAARRTKI